ncbi:hypothetical protein [Chitinasiproducens palmae]|uniref:Uncharacterized protein n=1 Tax=Chitinasiproducens palmae TaxID=1770053 RepID=A0A1H2PSA3_9BURK|nr:hypothetical protein [Chitinasiproducens palmae]SDV49825.1 hypothetical protein SAMN05216551_109170 [Chitinasiproducens palmae]
MTTLPQWPDRLPAPRQDSYGYQPQSPFIRTSMDAGTAAQRRRFTRVPTQVSVVWRFDRDQLELFEGFVAYEIAGGAVWFETRLANGRGVRRVKARMCDDSSPYKVSYVGDSAGYFDVSATLETIDMPTVTATEYDALRLVGAEGEMLALAQQYYDAINTTLPTGDVITN